MLALATCTPAPSATPSTMPSEVLAHQDPAADTSKNPVLSRSEAHYEPPIDPEHPPPFGCRALACTSGGASGIAPIVVALALIRRRPRR